MRISHFILLSALLTACSPKTAVIEVGTHHADANAVAKRAGQERLLRPETKDGEALASIIDGWVSDEVLASRGKAVTQDELAKERARLEADQKIAALYREVSKVYGDDKDLFMQVALLPDMAKRRIAEVYLDESAGASEGREAAEALLTGARTNPEAFAAAAATTGADVREVVVTPEGGVRDDAGHMLSPFAEKPDAELKAAQKVYEIARGAKDGDVLGLLLRTPNGHLIAKRLKAEKDGVRLVAAVTRNGTFGAWLQGQAKALADAGKLTVCIRDEALRNAYLQAAKVSLLTCPAK